MLPGCIAQPQPGVKGSLGPYRPALAAKSLLEGVPASAAVNTRQEAQGTSRVR